jgi:hypothetical protein
MRQRELNPPSDFGRRAIVLSHDVELPNDVAIMQERLARAKVFAGDLMER